jgi:antitoxin HicB
LTEYGYTTIFEPIPEGGFSVLVPAIPEICTFGDTIEEAREMARDAIQCYLESALQNGEPISF